MNRRVFLATAATAAAATACTPEGPRPAPPTAPASRTTSSAPAGGPDWPALRQSLGGRLVRPDDPAYPVARQLYNTRFDVLRPAAIAYVTTPDDIRECLAFAARAGVPLRIRNGGHAYTGWSSADAHLIIDVSAMNAVRREGGEAVTGAGARLIDVYTNLAKTGGTIPAGSCPTVGTAGLALGGGHGVTSRAYGLTCDNLTAATLVTADGRERVCSATENPDLFWALRGAGNGNFGVVTELRFRLRPAPDTVTAHLNWPWSRAEAVLDAWQRWGPDQPDEIWSSVQLRAAPGSAPTLSMTVFSLGDPTGLRNAVDRLSADAGVPASEVALRHRSYEEAMLAYAGCADRSPAQCHLPGPTPGRSPQGTLGRETYAARSDFFRTIPAAGLRTLLAWLERVRGGEASVILTALGGAVNRVEPLATAFVHRDHRVLAQYIAAWQPESSGAAAETWLKSAHAAMRGYATGSAYQNYADPTLTNWRTAYYGSAAERLTALKRRYDPDRVFDFPQAL